MAKRKSKASIKKSSKSKKTATSNDEAPARKVSAETIEATPESKDEGVKAFVCVIPVADRPDGNCAGQEDSCPNQPVVKWGSASWGIDRHYCEDCQEKELGGWPEGMDRSANLDKDDDNNKEDVTSKDDASNKDAKTEDANKEDVKTPSVASEDSSVASVSDAASKQDVKTPNVVSEESSSSDDDQVPSSHPDENASGLNHVKQEPVEEEETPDDIEMEEADAPISSDDKSTSGLDEEETPEVKLEGNDGDKASTTTKETNMVDAQDGGRVEEGEEKWELVEIYSENVITEAPIMCGENSEDPCPKNLRACVHYKEINLKSKEEWHGCLYCQDAFFDGWADEAKDIPAKNFSESHKRVMTDYCWPKPEDKDKDVMDTNGCHVSPEFPDFAKFYPDLACKTPSKKNAKTTAPTLTPIPPSQAKKTTGKKPVVTPSPHPPAFVAKVEAKRKKQQEFIKAGMNKAAIEMHLNWQKTAEEKGGPGAKIIVEKPKAKQVIMDHMQDSFRPMNITQIYEGLKATVPQGILKSSLDDMAALNVSFDTFVSDDEDDKDEKPKAEAASKKKESDDPFYGSLCNKAGRNANNSLYFLDYSKTKNGGDHDPVEMNEVMGKLAIAEAEKNALEHKYKTMVAQAQKLEAEPTNVDAEQLLSTEEPEMEELRATVEEARGLKANEKHKLKLKKAIEDTTAEWRKRKRLCLDFLNTMEENSDSFSKKKVLKGEHKSLYCEGDEYTIKQAREMANAKKKPKLGLGRKPKEASLADKNFIGMKLGSDGRAERVFLNP